MATTYREDGLASPYSWSEGTRSGKCDSSTAKAESAAASRSSICADSRRSLDQPRRSDLAAILYDGLDGQVETISATGWAWKRRPQRCRVSFDAAPREADLVVGPTGCIPECAGSPSAPEADVEVGLGYYVAASRRRATGRATSSSTSAMRRQGDRSQRFSMRDDKTLFLFVFRDQLRARASPSHDAERRACSRTSSPGWAGNVHASCSGRHPQRNLLRWCQPDQVGVDGQMVAPRWSATPRPAFAAGRRRHRARHGGSVSCCGASSSRPGR